MNLTENAQQHKKSLEKLEAISKEIKKGGGEKRIAKLHDKGKMTARERIDFLLDKDTKSFEIGLFAGFEMYEQEGGCPSAGVVVVIGKIQGRYCVVVANDATVKAGAWFPMTCKKNLRAQEIAMENRLPIIYLVDSAGVYLPMQDEVFPDKEHFGRIFRNNAQMSSMGIVQIAAVMGSCVAGGAYLPIMSDEALIVNQTGSIFLAGSYLVKAAIGEEIDNETLGGATTHCEISGVTDYKSDNDQDALTTIKNLIEKIGGNEKAGFHQKEAIPPKFSPDSLLDCVPYQGKPYDTFQVIQRIIDADSFEEYKKEYGKTLICAYARIDGWAVGIVANQRMIVKNGKNEMQIGGVIYSDSADKATRFIANCNQKKIPLVFLQDVNGFMVGSRSEHGGIIKDGAKMVNAVANSVVPKFTVVIGNSFGAGNYAMCGKAFDPRLIISWHNAKLAVMGGVQAGKVLLQIEKSKIKKPGATIDETTSEKILETAEKKYDKQTESYYAAARLWTDAIINPIETRDWIAMGITIANEAPIEKKFNMGVIQT